MTFFEIVIEYINLLIDNMSLSSFISGVFYLIWFVFILSILNFIRKENNRTKFKKSVIYNNKIDKKYIREYKDVSKDKLEKFNTDDINLLKDYFYKIFLDFENAYNNLDYNSMKILSTKQLYQNYYTGISLDLKVGKKRIIRDIERKKVILFELDSTTAKQIATALIEISYYNYMIDKKGRIISGSGYNKITEKFEVAFRKDFERKEITKCLNCGAEILGNRCDYCRSQIKNVEFKISSIRKVIE